MNDDISIVLALTLVFLAGALSSLMLFPELTTRTADTEPRERTIEPMDWNRTAEPLEEGVKTYIVGTTRDMEGVVTPAWVRAEEGSGRILVDIENLFFWVDIQHSIRTASSFAKEYLEVERDEYDLTYSIDLDVGIVGGPSAGATLTVATMAALKNTTKRDDVAMTGTIEPDGKIGRVGGIVEKARAAEKENFKKFLIPEGQTVQITYRQEESCRDVRGFEICRTRYVEEEIDVREKVDIEIVEVGYIEDALQHFLRQ